MPQHTETNRWLVLVLVCLAQFMVVLDATITNVALPSIQEDLDFSQGSLQWVINAYTLVFGGFLLLGGRAGDLFGRKRIFLAGVVDLHRRVAAQRPVAVGRDAHRRPRAAGPRRRARLPGRAVDHHDDVRRGRGPHEGARRLERDRRRRRRVRPAAGRHPHRPVDRGSGSSSSTCRSASPRSLLSTALRPGVAWPPSARTPSTSPARSR